MKITSAFAGFHRLEATIRTPFGEAIVRERWFSDPSLHNVTAAVWEAIIDKAGGPKSFFAAFGIKPGTFCRACSPHGYFHRVLDLRAQVAILRAVVPGNVARYYTLPADHVAAQTIAAISEVLFAVYYQHGEGLEWPQVARKDTAGQFALEARFHFDGRQHVATLATDTPPRYAAILSAVADAVKLDADTPAGPEIQGIAWLILSEYWAQ